MEETLALLRKDGGETTCAVDNTMARKMQLLWYTTEPEAYLAGMMRTTGQGGYLTVGEHSAEGYLPDNVIDSFYKLFPLVSFCVLHYTLFIIFYLYTIHYTLCMIALTRSSFLSCTFSICSSSDPRVMKR